LPKYKAWGDILRWCLQENVPGDFHLGLYPFKREGEILLECLLEKVDRKNQQTFSLCECRLPAKRLSTFDSVTLYGNDPHTRPDIYGKSGMQEFQFVVWMMLKIIFWFRFGSCGNFN
jgi:methylmalonyl-CoA mutase